MWLRLAGAQIGGAQADLRVQSAPRGRPVSLGGVNPVIPASEAELVASEAISEVAAAYGQCPKCGSDYYKQRPVRS